MEGLYDFHPRLATLHCPPMHSGTHMNKYYIYYILSIQQNISKKYFSDDKEQMDNHSDSSSNEETTSVYRTFLRKCHVFSPATHTHTELLTSNLTSSCPQSYSTTLVLHPFSWTVLLTCNLLFYPTSIVCQPHLSPVPFYHTLNSPSGIWARVGSGFVQWESQTSGIA